MTINGAQINNPSFTLEFLLEPEDSPQDLYPEDNIFDNVEEMTHDAFIDWNRRRRRRVIKRRRFYSSSLWNRRFG